MRFAQAIGVALVLLVLVPSTPASVRRLELGDLTRGATRIVIGEVTSVTAEWQDTKIVTRVTLSPETVLKGEDSKESFTFTIPGGTIGGITMHSGEAPKVRQGEEVVLFLRPGVCDCDIYGWFQGKYTISDGRIRELRKTTLDQFRTQIANFVESQAQGGR